MTFRTAHLAEYLDWLRSWLDAGNLPTHYYDYPWIRWTWLAAERDFTTGGECGAAAVNIIVPPGISHTGGDLGHNRLYFLDGPGQAGHAVPVFADRAFLDLPGVAVFVAEEFRKAAEREREANESLRERATPSDVTRWWEHASSRTPR